MPAEQAKLIRLPSRVSDVIFSGLYVFFFVNAAFFFLSECKASPAPQPGKDVKKVKDPALPSLKPYLKPVCEKAKLIKLDLAFELDAAWAKDVFPAEQDRVLQLIGSSVSLVLGLPLALVMIFGARGNNFQGFAILHATVLFVVGAHALVTGLQAKPKDRDVFEAAYLFMVAAPLALLHRWWGEKSFTCSKTYSGLRGLLSFLLRVACFFGLIFVATTVFDWAVSSHKELHGIPPTRPVINKYSAAAVQQISFFWQQLAFKLEEVGQEVVKAIKEFQK